VVAGDFVKLELVLVRGSLSLLFNRRAFTAEKEASSERVRAEVITSHS